MKLVFNAYEVHYVDAEGTKRIWATYGRDALAVTDSAFEMLEPGFRITRVCKVPNFDW